MIHPEKISRYGDNLENWMAGLPADLRKIPFIYLAIPGSHDSMTFDISSSSKIAPDAEPVIQCLKFLGPLLRVVVSRWGRTQDYDVTKQLKSGVRYFDLRIATKKDTDKLFFVHGLYAGEVQEKLNEVLAFLNEHPQEIVILDCQHFYEFHDRDHQHLMNMINATFGYKLLPYTYDMTKLSLDYLTVLNKYQIIAVYRSDAARDNQPKLWPSDSFPTPWPNTDNIDVLLSKLDTTLGYRNELKGFVSQCILTPSSEFVMKNLFGSLKKKCAEPLTKKQYEWITKQKPGPKGVNIIINDFVDLKEEQFAREVILLNMKLVSP